MVPHNLSTLRIYFLSSLIALFLVPASIEAQTSEPGLLSAPEFVLSQEALAAGIDGIVKTTLEIDDQGIVKGVRMFGEPVVPCGTSPKDELGRVNKALEAHFRLVKFSPEIKNGKAQATDVTLEFALGPDFRMGQGPERRIIRANILNGRATRLGRPFGARTKGIAEVLVLIDEQGNVAKAGLKSGHMLLREASVTAACDSKFPPPTLNGKPAGMIGVINYFFR